MLTEIIKNKQIFALLLIYALIATFIIFFFDGTGDSGDSILHYQFAKFAPLHPELFFNHWAKPVYVLLACPFAQFGFIGVKIFNTIVTLLTIFFTFKITQKLNISNAIIGSVIFIFSPLCFVLTFSGLTEPLFALFISIGLYALLVEKPLISCLLISFLPFVRSEGLIIIGVFSLYFFLKRKWKLIPLLLFGHVIYSIAGFFVFKDFFWVFNKIPYAHLSSIYGNGELSHFVEQLFYVIGAPNYILFWVGVIIIIWKSIKNKITIEVQTFVFLGFFSFFIAHSLFWYLGIFNSMGLKRVLIAVCPLMAIISLIGFNFLTNELFINRRILKITSQCLLLVYILIFPFTANPAAINWKTELNLSKDQQSALLISDFIAKNRDTNQCFVFSHPYLSEALKIDHFDNQKRVQLNNSFMNNIKRGDFVIWENWFAVVENGITKDFLDNNTALINLYNLRSWDRGREILYSVYKRK